MKFRDAGIYIGYLLFFAAISIVCHLAIGSKINFISDQILAALCTILIAIREREGGAS